MQQTEKSIRPELKKARGPYRQKLFTPNVRRVAVALDPTLLAVDVPEYDLAGVLPADLRFMAKRTWLRPDQIAAALRRAETWGALERLRPGVRPPVNLFVVPKIMVSTMAPYCI